MSMKEAILASIVGIAAVAGAEPKAPHAGFKERLSTPITQSATGNPLAFFNDGLSHWFERTEVRPTVFRDIRLPEITAASLKNLNINAVQNEFGQTLATAAALNFRADIIRTLKTMGVDMNQATPTRFPHTPLESLAMVHPENSEQRAARCETLKALVECGVDLNALDANGETFLMNISRQHDLPLMKLAKELGADTTIKNKDGKTADDIYRSVIMLPYNSKSGPSLGG